MLGDESSQIKMAQPPTVRNDVVAKFFVIIFYLFIIPFLREDILVKIPCCWKANYLYF